MEVAIGLGSGQTPSERTGIGATIDAAQAAEAHGLSLLGIDFGSLHHTRQLGEQVLPLVRAG